MNNMTIQKKKIKAWGVFYKDIELPFSVSLEKPRGIVKDIVIREVEISYSLPSKK